MKRSREGEAEDIIAMVNSLMLLSAGGGGGGDATRVFTCKTCNRQFPSFQALGGHRASHKKLRLAAGDHLQQPSSPPKPKTHECSICGLEFAIGQALGGHMRRHRATIADQNNPLAFLSLSPSQVPVVKKADRRRVLCLYLNLTPLDK
ncbi:hypothetical protein Pfo_027393 [Paulownia fortunei]|nr:hypothetical protein Pfo_027393 [Paulownia fortunei]